MASFHGLAGGWAPARQSLEDYPPAHQDPTVSTSASHSARLPGKVRV